MLVLRDVMAVLFYVCGMSALRGWNLRLLDRYAVPCFLLFLLACAAIVHFRVANTTYLRLIAPFLIWPATAWLATTRLGPWLVGMSKYSFFMFLAHAPVLLLTWLLYSRYGSALPYPLYWVMAPVLVTAILVAVYRIANVLMPRLFPVLIGAGRRAAPPAPAAGAMPVVDAPQAAGAKL